MARQAMPVQTGEVIDYKNEGTEVIAVGSVVTLGNCCGIAETDIEPGTVGALAITKVWEVDSVSSAAFAVGDLLYWDATNLRATKSATGNTPLGVCIAPKSSGGKKARVKLWAWSAATSSSGGSNEGSGNVDDDLGGKVDDDI